MYKKILCLSIGLLVCANALATWQRKDIAQPLAKKPTTILVYIAGDNSLAPYVHLDIEEMQKIGSNENVNILAYVSSADSSGKWTRALVINKGQAFQDGADMNKDSGMAQTAIDALDWAHTKFPSDNFVIVFWNHGSGPLNRNGLATTFFGKPWGTPADRAFCYDDTTGSYFNDQDLRAVLAHSMNMRKKSIDIVAFDACLMANIEVAYAIQPYAKYLVASEQTIPGEGYPYDTALNLAAKPKLSIPKMVADMVKDYGALYSNSTPDYTLSGIDLSKLPALRNAMDSLATILAAGLHSNDHAAVKHAMYVSGDPSKCTYFTEDSYLDIGHFLNNLQTNISTLKTNNKALYNQLKTAVANALTALKKCVVAQVHGANFPKSTGMSMYMERYTTLDPDYASTQWAQDSKWAHMLEVYVAS